MALCNEMTAEEFRAVAAFAFYHAARRPRNPQFDRPVSVHYPPYVDENGAIVARNTRHIMNTALALEYGDIALTERGNEYSIAQYDVGACSHCPLRNPSTCRAGRVVGVLVGTA